MTDHKDLESQVAKLKEEIETYINAESKEINQLKSTLDEIKNSFENDGICCVRCYGLPRKSLKKILAKHEGKQ